MRHHAFVIEAEAEEGIGRALAWAKEELGMEAEGNPDVAVLRHGLLSVADARRVSELAAGAAFAGESKIVIITANRAYHEAQNALLKVFEEPPQGVYLFLVLPSLGGLLPTLRSRVQILDSMFDFVNRTSDVRFTKSNITEGAREFMKATKEKRSAMIKKIAEHKADDAAASREEAIALLNGIEALYRNQIPIPRCAALLSDIATLRPYLYDRSAPVKMILEHIALVIPKDLL